MGHCSGCTLLEKTPSPRASSLASHAFQLAEEQAKQQRLNIWEDYEGIVDTMYQELEETTKALRMDLAAHHLCQVHRCLRRFTCVRSNVLRGPTLIQDQRGKVQYGCSVIFFNDWAKRDKVERSSLTSLAFLSIRYIPTVPPKCNG
ncbi:hypothetical protein HPB50_009836 [Hyalomma asiaticum]|uniref:Uncharacterized protein n=1 Tax=Hyalomma asiaticum TaxID=266040 RepID=A0ACB7TIC4_HYAAI|nr:hypothetical protein HPB50_009836 [Hyalomma asiaticum]